MNTHTKFEGSSQSVGTTWKAISMNEASSTSFCCKALSERLLQWSHLSLSAGLSKTFHKFWLKCATFSLACQATTLWRYQVDHQTSEKNESIEMLEALERNEQDLSQTFSVLPAATRLCSPNWPWNASWTSGPLDTLSSKHSTGPHFVGDQKGLSSTFLSLEMSSLFMSNYESKGGVRPGCLFSLSHRRCKPWWDLPVQSTTHELQLMSHRFRVLLFLYNFNLETKWCSSALQ